jgi:hypothetical protein
VRLRQNLFAEFAWLGDYFELQQDGSVIACAPSRWVVQRHQQIKT